MVIIRLLLLLSLTSAAYAEVGEVTEQTGSGMITRQQENITVAEAIPIEMEDYIVTARGIVGITFDDDTQVRVGEHSELVIDDFVYDPNAGGGSLGLRVSFGTVQYASGLIASNSPDTVDIRTPSASIAVRGTAFSMTVNEIGGSTIILLPNADGTVGEIEVMSDMGAVILNQAFQATVVSAGDNVPTRPITLSLSIDMISNLMIIAPPREIIEELQDEIADALSADLLEFEGLTEDLLAEDEDFTMTDLDIDLLGVDLLANLLTSAFADIIDGRTAGFNPETQIYTFIEEPVVRVVRIGENQTFDMRFQQQAGVSIDLQQGAARFTIDSIDGGSSNKVRIIQ